jgi:uncharacterized iron-regulated membrane protein
LFIRIAFWSHTLLGLSLGLVMLALGLTGSVLVYRPELERAMYPQFFALEEKPTGASLDQALAAAQAHAGTKATSVRLSATTNEALEFSFRLPDRRTMRVYVDANTSQVLGTRQTDWILTLHAFHHDLFAPGTGRKVLGYLGWALVALAGTGLATLLRRSTVAAQAFREPWSARSLHYVTGAVALPVLLIIALTSTAFTWGSQYRSLLRVMSGAAVEESPKGNSTGAEVAGVEQVLAAARAALPDAEATLIRIPERTGDPIVVRFRADGDMRRIGNHQVWVEPDTLKVLRVSGGSRRTLDVRVSDSFFPLHTGEFGGELTRFLWAAAGLAPGFLFLSGFLVWMRRVRPNRNTVQSARAMTA